MDNTVSMDKVNSALSKIESLQQETDVFDVKDVTLKIRTLSGEELEKVYEKANPIFQKAVENENQFSLENWMSAIRLETMTYSIIQIDDIDLTGVNFLKDSQGNKKQKHVFLREKLKGWDRSVINVCFQKFKELEIKADEKAKEGVEFETQDLDEKIEEKEQELQELKEKKAKQDAEKDIEQQSFSKMSQDELKNAVFSKSEEVNLSEDQKEKEKEAPDQNQEPVYVNEDGEELSEEEIKAVKQIEKRQEQKTQMSDAEARQVRKRPRMNHQNPEVQRGSNPEQQKSRLTPKQRRQKDLPMAPGYEDYEPGVLTPEDEKDKTKNKKDPTVNPKFKGDNHS